MRVVPFIISTVITLALIFALSKRWGDVPELGRFLSPQAGFWQSAEPGDEDRNEDFQFTSLRGNTTVYLDDRLVPHVFADNDADAYFVQGYLHARYRLWQMDFQTRYAAGRLSEILNNSQLENVDRMQRRTGMVYAAENMIQELEKDSITKMMLDAYTAGVNSYITSVTEATLPFEYKLLGYTPEPWNNLKTALFVKLMSADLAGLQYARDISFSNMKSVFSLQEMGLLFPQVPDSTQPIIPSGTPFTQSAVIPTPPADVDSAYYGNDTTINPVRVTKPIDMNGSNSWAVNGTKTATGAPILCNDPHLGLTLPSIWYEMQMHTPTMNAYGVTFPSIPGIIIGFNDSVSFGFTNAGRDVIDYYRIRFRDSSRNEYWYNGQWQAVKKRVEEIKKKDGSVLRDSVAYTVFGPVVYDHTFNNGDTTITSALAMRWTAHDPSNEFRMWYKLDRANNYDDYVEAIKGFSTPGQNMLFAAKSGTIAIWQQGKFPLRWPGQGLYVMPGEDTAYRWRGWIPQQDNPHVVNPAQNFIQSANQRPVDSTYPYFIPGDYIAPRGVSVHSQLDTMQNITVQDMMRLQSDVYSPFAADAVPFLLKHVEEDYLGSEEKNLLQQVRNWNYYVTAESTAATVYQLWYDSLEKVIWSDELAQVEKTYATPNEQALFENLVRDSAFRFIDNVNTPQEETLRQQVTTAFKMATATLDSLQNAGGLEWWKYKSGAIRHLLRDAVPSLGRYNIRAGGWGNVINAFTRTHGPSWRMIVSLTPQTEAYGIYPGGQSGNPGSFFFDNFVDDWAAGKYYRLWMMKEAEATDKRIFAKFTFSKA